MVYIGIDNKNILTKVITYLEENNIGYTTSNKDDFDMAIIDKIDSKRIKFSKKVKTIFIAYNYEEKIYKDELYKNKMKDIINNFYKIIFSMECFKSFYSEIKTKIYIIHKPNLNIDKRKVLNFNKYVIVNDFEYNNLDLMFYLANKYDYKYYYIGYKRMNKKEKKIYNELPSNVIKIKYIDYFDYIDVVKKCYMVIDTNDYTDINYIKIPILFKKKIILKKIDLYSKYLIANKHVYYFKDIKELILKVKKIKENRLSNLTDEAYFKIKEDSDKNISIKCKAIIK